MKPRRAIIIDARNRRVTETTVNNLADMQKLVDGYIEVAMQLPNGDEIYVNEEGLFRDDFTFGFAPRPNPHEQLFVGNGFILGAVNGRGDSTDAKSTLEEVHQWIMFLGRSG